MVIGSGCHKLSFMLLKKGYLQVVMGVFSTHHYMFIMVYYAHLLLAGLFGRVSSLNSEKLTCPFLFLSNLSITCEASL